MYFSIPTALQLFTASGRAVSALTAWGKRARGDSKALVLELRDNMVLLDMAIDDDIELGLVIDRLSHAEYDRLAKAGFNFNALKRKKIARLPSLDGTDLAVWQGRTTGELIESIYVKIHKLRIRYPLVGNNPKYRWGIRAQNIRKRIWLLLRHVGA